MRTLKDAGDMRGKRVFVRCDFNVPVTSGAIDDAYRIRKALPTLEHLLKSGAKVVIASHIETEGDPTLRPVHEYLASRIQVSFVEDYFPNDISEAVNSLSSGSAVLLENLRKYPEEKKNDDAFARHLASLADIYVDDAFASAHREHASIVGVPKHIPSYAGLLMEEEVSNLSKALDPVHPFLFILGGAKFETKLPLVKKFLELADAVFVGGALGNDLIKAKGMNVGRSKVSEGVDVSRIAEHPKVMLPKDVVVHGENGSAVKRAGDVADDETIVDAGPETLRELQAKLASAPMVLWNGPLGNFEAGFTAGTEALAKAIAGHGGHSIVGGGDTLSSISGLGLEDKFTFVSTGGGAMLDFLANGSLPGTEALQ